MLKADIDTLRDAVQTVLKQSGLHHDILSARLQPKRDRSVELSFSVNFPLPEGVTINDAAHAVGVIQGMLYGAALTQQPLFPGQKVKFEKQPQAYSDRLVFPNSDYLAMALNVLLPADKLLLIDKSQDKSP